MKIKNNNYRWRICDGIHITYQIPSIHKDQSFSDFSIKLIFKFKQFKNSNIANFVHYGKTRLITAVDPDQGFWDQVPFLKTDCWLDKFTNLEQEKSIVWEQIKVTCNIKFNSLYPSKIFIFIRFIWLAAISIIFTLEWLLQNANFVYFEETNEKLNDCEIFFIFLFYALQMYNNIMLGLNLIWQI